MTIVSFATGTARCITSIYQGVMALAKLSLLAVVAVFAWQFAHQTHDPSFRLGSRIVATLDGMRASAADGIATFQQAIGVSPNGLLRYAPTPREVHEDIMLGSTADAVWDARAVATDTLTTNELRELPARSERTHVAQVKHDIETRSTGVLSSVLNPAYLAAQTRTQEDANKILGLGYVPRTGEKLCPADANGHPLPPC